MRVRNGLPDDSGSPFWRFMWVGASRDPSVMPESLRRSICRHVLFRVGVQPRRSFTCGLWMPGPGRFSSLRVGARCGLVQGPGVDVDRRIAGFEGECSGTYHPLAIHKSLQVVDRREIGNVIEKELVKIGLKPESFTLVERD